MNVLVTGGAGYIGSHTCVELLNRGYGVVVIDNLVNSNPKAIERVEEITGKKVAFYENDVRDRAALDRIFEKHDIGCAIHFAGLKAVGESVAMPLEYYDNNLNSTIQLCRAMKDHGVKDIVFSSSATVYSGDNEVPLRETSKTGNCTNPYGWTKYMSVGDDYNTPDGTGVRDYIHVVDLARGHVCAIEYMMKHRGENVFNLGTGTGYSVLDMVKAFERVTGVKIPYEIAPRRPGDLATVYSSPDKSAQLLGWKAQYNLDDMCRDTWAWQSKNPMGYES